MREGSIMAIIKCKMCGGDLELIPGSSVAECEYCGTKQTVPAADNEKKLAMVDRANRLRAACDFDKAFGVFESIVAEFPNEAEAYWGLVLCRYGIEYVTDPATGKKVPTCHRSSYDSVLSDVNLDLAMENADIEARRIYREESHIIEDLRKGIIEVSSREEPYDIFICYKETGFDGQRTLDSVLAQDIYKALTHEGYRVFFSRITLEDKLGVEYEPYIFAALNSAKVMLAVGMDFEHFNAPWVKNEWSRFLKLMAKDHSKHLIPCFKDIGPYDMPDEFAKLQAQDMGKIGAMQDLIHGVEKLLNKKQTIVQPVANDAVSTLLASAQTYVQLGDYDVAERKFKEINDKHPQIGQAWWGRVVCATRDGNYMNCDINLLNKWMQNAKKTTKPADFVPMERKYVEYLQNVSGREVMDEDAQLRRKLESHRQRLSELDGELYLLNRGEEERKKQLGSELYEQQQEYRGGKIMKSRSGRTKFFGVIKLLLGLPFLLVTIAGVIEDGINFTSIIVGGILLLIAKTFLTKGWKSIKEGKAMKTVGLARMKLSEQAQQNLRDQDQRAIRNYNAALENHQLIVQEVHNKISACEAYLSVDMGQRQNRCFAYNCRSIGVSKPCDQKVQDMYEATL